METIERENVDSVLPTGDGAMVLANAVRDEVPKTYIGCPPPEIVETVLDKERTLESARRCGIRVPETWAVADPQAAAALLGGKLPYPLVSKPRVRKGASSFKVKYLRSAEEALGDLQSNPTHWDDIILQEYIEGVGVGIGTFIDRGDPVFLFQHRRLKELPYSGGVSVTAVSEQPDKRLAEAAVALLRDLSWQGVAMVEFRYDPESRDFALMEVNGRYWGSIFLTPHAGIDVPYYEWQLAHDQVPNPPGRYRYGVAARWLSGDIERLLNLWADPHQGLERPHRGIETLQFFLDFLRPVRSSLWSWRDPVPALDELRFTIAYRLKALVKGVAYHLLPSAIRDRIRFYRGLGKRRGRIHLRRRVLQAAGRAPRLEKLGATARKRVLFICLGNIMRSPFAAHLLRKHVDDSGQDHEVQSSGLWRGLESKPPRASPDQVIAAAGTFGLDLSAHRSQPTTRDLLDWADVVFVMDFSNEATLLERFPDVGPKVLLLGQFGRPAGASIEIQDPYGGTQADIERTYRRIERAIEQVGAIVLRGKGDG